MPCNLNKSEYQKKMIKEVNKRLYGDDSFTTNFSGNKSIPISLNTSSYITYSYNFTIQR
jgi:hypothetical protein